MDLPERLLPKVASRLGLGRVVFKPYTREQITAILSARLRGLPAFDPHAIKLASAQVREGGGMRLPVAHPLRTRAAAHTPSPPPNPHPPGRQH